MRPHAYAYDSYREAFEAARNNYDLSAEILGEGNVSFHENMAERCITVVTPEMDGSHSVTRFTWSNLVSEY